MRTHHFPLRALIDVLGHGAAVCLLVVVDVLGCGLVGTGTGYGDVRRRERIVFFTAEGLTCLTLAITFCD